MALHDVCRTEQSEIRVPVKASDGDAHRPADPDPRVHPVQLRRTDRRAQTSTYLKPPPPKLVSAAVVSIHLVAHPRTCRSFRERLMERCGVAAQTVPDASMRVGKTEPSKPRVYATVNGRFDGCQTCRQALVASRAIMPASRRDLAGQSARVIR